MRAFLRHPAAYDDWRSIGGRDTLASYGLPRRLLQEREGILRTWREFNLVIPAHHRAFIEDLPVLHRAGDYVFVHAGIRPGKPVEEQVVQDLLWIRTEFLSCEDDYGFVVVHGHTPSRQVEFRTNRIGVDTGAYATRILSCILLQDDRAVVIQARPDFVGPVEPNLMAIG
jgi:serine/threonine protein phosphatase 1